jgi:lambda family phage tail tape measure protein
MASQNINIGINLSTNNTGKKVLKDVREIHSEVKATQAAASKINMGGTAARAGQDVTGTDYRRARGLTEVTGAGARDFARQSQGLGGLVRLYATYAANLFAVSAAFQALSQAMNTENMIRGLDQLSAASGQSLGNLAKQFTIASGGAISLRESMEATTKAISSGLTEQQFLKLGDVAKKASQALGINMSDAVSRLTRGITKLEPELLDELGIFTKLDKATEEYAKTVGKSTSSLTDFERRQAFANAVLAEGIQKFGEINIPTNPYDKLLATLKDLLQTGLTLVNTVLGPIISLLSSSPVALAGILGAIGVNLLKNVIPVLGQFRQSIAETAQQARDVATQRATAAQEALAGRRQAILKATTANLDATAQRASDALDDAEARFNQAVQKGVAKRTEGSVKRIQDILKRKDIDLISQKDIDFIDNYGKRLKTTDNIYTQLASSIRTAKREQDNFFKGVQQQQDLLAAEPGALTPAGLAARDAKKAEQKAGRLTLISVGFEQARIDGIREAWKDLNKNIKTEGLTKGQAALTRISGAAAIGIGRLTTFAGTLGSVGIAALAAFGIFQMLESIFGKNQKEVQEFYATVDALETSLKTATDTAKKYNEQLSSESIIAISNAFDGVNTSLEKLISNLEQADRKAGWFDRFIDGFKTLIGQDLKTQFAKNFQLGILGALDAIDDPELKNKAEEQLALIFGLQKQTVGLFDIEEAIQAAEPEKLFRLAKGAQEVIGSINKEYKAQKQVVTEAKDATKALETAYRDLANSFINNDPGTKFAEATISQLNTLSGLLDSGRTRFLAFEQAAENVAFRTLLPEDSLEQIRDISAEYSRLQAEIVKARRPVLIEDIGPIPIDYAESAAIAPSMEAVAGSRELTKEFKLQETQVEQLTKQLQDAAKEYDKVSSEVDRLTNNLNSQKTSQQLLSQTIDDLEQNYDNIVKLLDEAGNAGVQLAAKLGLGVVSGELDEASNTANILNNNINTLEQQLSLAQQEAMGLKNVLTMWSQELVTANTKAQGLSATVSNINNIEPIQAKKLIDSAAFEKEGQRLANLLREKIQQALTRAATIIISPLVQAINRSQIDIQKSLIQGLPATPAQVQETLRLELASIDLRRQEIRQMGDLVNALERNRLSADLREAKQEAAQSFLDGPEAQARAFKRVDEIEAELRVLLNPEKYISKIQEIRAAQKSGSAPVIGANLQDLSSTGAQKQIIRIAGQEKQLRELATQEQLAQIKAVQDTERARFAKLIQNQKISIDNQRAENQLFFQSEKFQALSAQDQKTNRESAEATLKVQQAYVQSLEDQQKLGVLQVALVEAKRLGVHQGVVNAIDEAAKAQDTANTAAQINRNIALQAEASEQRRKDIQERQVSALDQQSAQAEQRFQQQNLAVEVTLEQLNLEKEQLDNLKESNKLTDDAYNKQSIALQIRQLQLESFKEELSIKQKIRQIELDRDKKLVTATGEDADNIRETAKADIEGLQQRLIATKNLTAAKIQDLEVQQQITARTKAYENIFENTFSNLGDALVEWSRTGKFAGKELFNSLIQDLARYELRLQTLALYDAIRPGIKGVVSSIFGGVATSATTVPTGPAGAVVLGGPGYAKGGAFDSGVRKYAKGGMFTNSIVSEPTLFKFAKGTGLMGEAGPEAIMPLKRDSQGNLGVRASNQGAKVEVIVNNNSSTPATATETVDSRGNRRIEVTVGDMISGEMVRPGSSMRQTMQTNYGLRPSLVRR